MTEPQLHLHFRRDLESLNWYGSASQRPDLEVRGVTLRRAKARLLEQLGCPSAQASSISIALPEALQAEYDALLERQRTLDELAQSLPMERLKLARSLLALPLGVGDAAHVLGISPNRLNVLLRRGT